MKNKKSKKKIFIILGVIAAIAIVAFWLISRAGANAAAALANSETAVLQRGNLTALVGGTGTVSANQTAQMIWSTSGIIGEINVQTGDKVKADQVLASLQKSSLPQNIISSEAELVNAKRALEDLQDSDAARAQAQLTLAQTEQALTDAKDDLDSKQYQRASQATIDGLKADLILAQNNLDDANDLFTGVADRAENDPIRAAALSQLSNAQKAYDRAKYNLDYAEGLPDANDLAQAQAKVEVAQANYDDAKRKYERIQDGVDPDDIAAAQARVDAAQAAVDTQYLKAPFAGTITESNSKVGDQVSIGTTSFRIDDLSHLLVDVNITEVDINQVKVGQAATLAFDAIRNKTYNGSVTEVALVGTQTQGSVNFTVTIELTDADSAVLPGMTAAVNIVTSEIDDVLLVPNRAVKKENNKTVVYVLQNGMPTAVEIELGASENSYSEILSGDVKEGDTILLNPPTTIQMGPGGMGGGMQ